MTALGITTGSTSTPANPVLTNYLGQAENGRCGFGPRLPFIVISPYAKADYISHTLIDQASVVNFIEYNWGLGKITGSAANLFNNPSTAFDLADMFDFTPGAADVAGSNPYYLGDPTFQSVSAPNASSLPPQSGYGHRPPRDAHFPDAAAGRGLLPWSEAECSSWAGRRLRRTAA